MKNDIFQITGRDQVEECYQMGRDGLSGFEKTCQITLSYTSVTLLSSGLVIIEPAEGNKCVITAQILPKSLMNQNETIQVVNRMRVAEILRLGRSRLDLGYLPVRRVALEGATITHFKNGMVVVEPVSGDECVVIGLLTPTEPRIQEAA